MPTTTYNCPVLDCTWTHTDPGPQPLADDAPEADVHAESILHGATVEHALRAHYETHDAEAWVRTVQALHAELATRSVSLLCTPCLAERYAAQQTGRPLPPLNPAQVIANGTGLCSSHVQFGPPQIPGRTPGGLILGGT